MKKEFKPFPLYEFSGTEREIGQQIGEELREQIKQTIPYWFNTLSTIFPDSLEKMISTCKVFEKPAREYAPNLWEQIEGIAAGANMSTDEILFIQGGWELDGCGLAPFGCTDFGATDLATKDGKTIVGQNFDWYPEAPTIVIKVKPKDKPAYLSVTWPGHLAQVGITEAGFGLFINILITQGNGRVGVPYSFITNNALNQKNVSDAIRVIRHSNAASSFDYTIGGKDGELVNVELAASHINGFRAGMVFPEDDIITHANFYLTPHLIPDGLDVADTGDIFLRDKRIRKLMKRHYGELTPQHMMEILQDHQDWPDSICRHCDLTGPVGEQFETIFSCISVPAEGKMWATANPCQNPYTLYTL